MVASDRFARSLDATTLSLDLTVESADELLGVIDDSLCVTDLSFERVECVEGRLERCPVDDHEL